MVYPAVIVTAMIGNAIVMLVFVLPKMSEVFSTLNLKLPPTTKFILALGNFVGDNTNLVLGTIGGLIILTIATFMWHVTREMFVAILTKVPLVKKLRDQIDVSRFSRTLSTLLDNGVPIMEALDVSADVVDQKSLKRAAKSFSEGVGRGEALSDVIEEGKKVFPKVVTQSIKAGEKTGSLGQVLIELAEFYEKEVDYTLKNLTALIEPIIMIVIGVGVGALVVMMIVPIYSVVGGMGGGL
jgi:type IV pilus assembly protein PilC